MDGDPEMKLFGNSVRLWQSLKSDPLTLDKVKRLKPLAWRAFVMLIFSEVLMALEAYPLRLFVDALSAGPEYDFPFGLGRAGYIGALIVLALAIYFMSHLVWRLMANVRNSAMWLFFVILNSHGTRKQLQLGADWHVANGTGAKESVLAKNLKKADYMHDEFFFAILPITIRNMAIAGGLFFMGWQFGVLAIVTMTGYLCWAVLVTERRLMPLRKDYRSYTKRIERSDTEMAATAITIKEQGLEQQLAQAHDDLLMEHWRKEVPRSSKTLQYLWYQSQLVVGAQVCFLVVSALLCVKYGLGLGTYVLANAWTFRIFGDLWRYGEFQRVLNEGLVATGELADLYETEPSIKQLERPVWPRRPMGQIVFDGVRFAYPGADVSALLDVNLQIEPGTTVALVGPSGGGKSTFAKLLTHQYDPDIGRILVDGVDLRNIDDLRYRQEMVSLVPQEPGLFDRTVAENIRIVRPEATDEEVQRAAVMAGAAEFIERLPAGYDSVIGERGVMLSGGQRQRLALARALLRGGQILVLDEPTSALDAESQLLVRETLEALTAGRDLTIVIIAHRFSTIAMADLVVVVDGGRIVEVGTHTELLSNAATYARLHELEGVAA